MSAALWCIYGATLLIAGAAAAFVVGNGAIIASRAIYHFFQERF